MAQHGTAVCIPLLTAMYTLYSLPELVCCHLFQSAGNVLPEMTLYMPPSKLEAPSGSPQRLQPHQNLVRTC